MKPTLTFLASLLAYNAHAQLLTADNVPVTLTGGVTVTVEGGVRLQNAANFSNDGLLRLTGDWTNNSGNSGITPASGGGVLLFGANVQQVGGGSVTDFRHLTITGGDKLLLQDAVAGLPTTPTGTLTLDGARLLLNGRTFTLFNPTATALVDAGGSIVSETSDLLSRFQWALGADVGEHRIPFSDAAGAVFPFAFTPAAPYPANTLLSVATYPTAPDNTPYPVTAVQQVTHMAGYFVADNSDNTADRFWLVDLPNTDLTGTLLLSHLPAEDPLSGPGPIRAQRWLESIGTWQAPLPGQSNPGLREALVPAVLFSDGIAPQNEHIWALAYDLTPLPISLLYFDAKAVDNTFVRCTWATVSEQNNDFFTVERSRDGITFEEVGQVPGAGTSITTLHYAFDDQRPYSGVSYYRLRQTDYDGTATWSQTVPVMISPAVDIAVFPNPNQGQFTIARSDADEDLHIHLLDGAGRLVRQWVMPRGTDRQWVDLGAASGLYTLHWPGGRIKVSVGR
ncbi:MAG: hypothetical protein KIT10_03430 [Flavobacteriales bacterium]|nr:hypothetical protein [Flavobacteriales bacterium]